MRAQSVAVDEIIVVDDDSSDGTFEVARQLGVRALRVPHGGPGAARNAGIAAATSEWIATLDADDVWHSRKLELQYDAIDVRPELGLVFTDFDAVSLSDGRMHKPDVVSDDARFERLPKRRLTDFAVLLEFDAFLEELPARSIILPSTALFRRRLALEIGGFSRTVKAEDTEFFLRLASRGEVAFVALPLLAYTRHATQITATWSLDSIRMALYHHVMANPASYHALTIRGYRKHYAKLLYFMAARSASERRFGRAIVFALKSVALAAATRGATPILLRTVAASALLRSFRGRLGVLARRASPKKSPSAAIPSSFGDVVIPWRGRPSGAAPESAR